MSTRRRDRLLARALLATKAIDRGYQLFDRSRSRIVARSAPDGVVSAFNEIAYGADAVYNPTTSSFRSRLFPWEATAIRDHFPPAPARVLVGGAGGGREPFALAALGYDVVAFEPAAGLAAAMADRSGGQAAIRAYRAGYEDLPVLHPARSGGESARLDELGPFAAAVLGWGSFSHLMTRADRLHALREVAAVTSGPGLVSFLVFDADNEDAEEGTSGGEAHFSIYIGWHRSITAQELRALADEAGLTVVSLNTDETESVWPHAILRRTV